MRLLSELETHGRDVRDGAWLEPERLGSANPEQSDTERRVLPLGCIQLECFIRDQRGKGWIKPTGVRVVASDSDC
jgi:hypothetical protein